MAFSGLALLLLVAITIIGIVLVTLGLRGRPVLSSPRCAKCSYDLRALNFMSETIGPCPECGVDLKPAGAVSFGRHVRRTTPIVLGIVLMILPWLGFVLLLQIFSTRARVAAAPPPIGPVRSASLPTPALIAGLSKTIDQPWDWQELQNRWIAGKLTQQDVDASYDVLIGVTKARNASGQAPQPLSWADQYLIRTMPGARGTPTVTPAKFAALCQAFFDVPAKLEIRDTARQGEQVEAKIELYAPWDLANLRACWALNRIEADGGAYTLAARPYYEKLGNPNPDTFSAIQQFSEPLKINNTLPPGEHEISIVVDCGAISHMATLRGLDGKPGTADKWPNPVATWQIVIKHKLRVVGRDESVVSVITDDARDPLRNVKLSVQELLARSGSKGTQVLAKFSCDGVPSIPLSYNVSLTVGKQTVPLGPIFINARGGRQNSIANLEATVASLPPDVSSADITLTPDAKAAERQPGVEQIWGKPTEFKNVPLQRFDQGPAK